MKITFSGWPWQFVNSHWASNLDKTTGQRWGWNPFNMKGMGRFSGGRAFKFGVVAYSDLRDIIIELGIGSIRIIRAKKGGA